MTDKRISEFTQITGSDVDDANDEIVIVDTSASETKAITREELFSSVASATFDGSVTIGGDLTVSGTTVTVDTTTLDVADKNITIAKDAPDAATADGAGLTVDGANATITYDSTDDTWDFNKGISTTGDIEVTGTVDGRDVAADGSKLDGIESGATADQTAGEIKTAYESNADTNAFTDAEQSKLSGIESGAEVNTVDSVNTQTGTVVLDADDIDDSTTTNKFTTAADKSKLDGIETNADVTDTANVTAAGALMDSELTSEASVKALDQGVATTDSPEFAGITVDEATLTAIAASKADTAVDVFVYDTSKDSDGGAWRHRTQHTSWYNETLNTSTRGSRREFPAVAVIVAEANQVTIYDGDDPALPMWMVFNGDLGALKGSTTISSLSVFNGLLCITHNNGVARYGFLNDKLRRDFVAVSSSQIGDFVGYGIADRNTNLSGKGSGVVAGEDLVNASTNDVAMTVLPDAPIDPATGIQRVTIACATAGGVSVIKDDGTVYDSDAGLSIGRVGFTASGGLWYSRDSANFVSYYASRADYEAGDGFGDLVAHVITGIADIDLLTRANEQVVAEDHICFGGISPDGDAVAGLMLHQPNYTDQSKGMSALLTSTYNTGWMNGDIKGAFLSDTNDTDLVGSGELVTNGTFDTDTDWTKEAGWTISSGKATYTSGDVGREIWQTISTVAGRAYIVTYDVVDYISQAVGVYSLESKQNSAIYEGVSAGTFSRTLVATGTSMTVRFRTINPSADLSIDNVSIKLADEDRSVNNNGLIVNGTVTRSPVATGADLVAYSGFSASNYLEQPYNSDLDFGTGDFCVMGWVKIDVLSGTSKWFFDLGDQIELVVNENTFVLNSGGTDQINTGTPLPVAQWLFVCGVRTGSNLALWLNGELLASITNINDVSHTGSLIIGNRSIDLSRGFDGSLALWRISATAPTAEQIKKIYEDEKFLFQENAQATLYGTSDAVTALAHDPVTDLLHVGTSDGRSVFQGLRRVDNTTDAVSTAISASNDLIVEQ